MGSFLASTRCGFSTMDGFLSKLGRTGLTKGFGGRTLFNGGERVEIVPHVQTAARW
ncbi:hypothetical protein Mapa_009070 [Marchantia paleacea]|nr:hypothetical protein Mapa_009070 [Marchantia paleacea]